MTRAGTQRASRGISSARLLASRLSCAASLLLAANTPFPAAARPTREAVLAESNPGTPVATARRAPVFSLEGTSGQVRTLQSYAGRVALVMYEDRDSNEVNAALKAEVKQRIEKEKLQRELVIVPIADVRSYDYWPVRGFVRSAVVSRAAELGVEILLDWSGDVVKAYGFRSPGSNVALIARDSTLRYLRPGPLDAAARRAFHAVLTEALAASAKARAEPRP